MLGHCPYPVNTNAASPHGLIMFPTGFSTIESFPLGGLSWAHSMMLSTAYFTISQWCDALLWCFIVVRFYCGHILQHSPATPDSQRSHLPRALLSAIFLPPPPATNYIRVWVLLAQGKSHTWTDYHQHLDLTQKCLIWLPPDVYRCWSIPIPYRHHHKLATEIPLCAEWVVFHSFFSLPGQLFPEPGFYHSLCCAWHGHLHLHCGRGSGGSFQAGGHLRAHSSPVVSQLDIIVVFFIAPSLPL